MKRYNYGQNFQVLQSSKMSVLTPLGFMEAVPGDTFTGKFTAKTWSDTTRVPITNRTYMDVFCFYVPYRLLWDQWTDFISGEAESAPSLPTVTGRNPFFFEPAGFSSVNIAFPRRAYNLIVNKFFRLPRVPELSLDNAIQVQVPQRQTTYHERALPEGSLIDQQVQVSLSGDPVDDASIGIDDLRAGFAQDRWNRTRDYYGKKYVDYLNALGVRSGWSIAEEPELIGKAQRDWQYNTTTATFTGTAQGTPEDANFVGDPAGFFQGQTACKIRDTFCPEHGLIFMVGLARMDIINRDVGQPLFQKAGGTPEEERQRFWSPEFETKTVQEVNGAIFGSTPPAGAEVRNFDDYRVQGNLYGQLTSVTDTDRLYQATYQLPTASPDDYAVPPESAYNSIFVGNMGGAENVHYCVANEVRMVRKSPIRPPQRIKGVS